MDEPSKVAGELSKPEVTTAIKLTVHGIFALCGGVVHEMTRGKAPSLLRYTVGGFVGMFTGFVVYCGCKHLELGEWATMASVAMGGYTGAPLLDLFSVWMRRKAGEKIDNK